MTFSVKIGFSTSALARGSVLLLLPLTWASLATFRVYLQSLPCIQEMMYLLSRLRGSPEA